MRIFQSYFFSVLLFIAYLVDIYFTDFIFSLYINFSDCGLIIYLKISQLFTFFSISITTFLLILRFAFTIWIWKFVDTKTILIFYS